MDVQDCEIILDNPWSTYYAGHTVNGLVKLTLNSPTTIQGILIRFMGEANTRWSKTKKVYDKEGQEHDGIDVLTGHQRYFDKQYYLLGNKNEAQLNLVAGEHTYAFSFVLPTQLPTSYEDQFGYIRYTIKVSLHCPWKFCQDFKMAFSVISPLDLNQVACLKEPMGIYLEKTFCFSCFGSGPLRVDIVIPVGGYVSGQSVPFVAEINNACGKKVDFFRIYLVKTTLFKAKFPRQKIKSSKTIITEISFGSVGEHCLKHWQENIEIPALPPSNLDNNNIIEWNYELKFELCVLDACRRFEGKLPIILGSVPLTTTQSPSKSLGINTASPPLQESTQSAPLRGESSNAHVSNLKPTYVESEYRANIINQNDAKDTRLACGGQGQFAPRYSVYEAPNISTMPQMYKETAL